MTARLGVADAAFHTVHDYAGGATALSVRMGKSPNQLSDEVSPTRPGAKLGLLDAVKAQLLADDFRILYAMALDCGYFPPVRMPMTADGEAMPSLQRVGELAREFGELMATVSGSLGDGAISDRELRDVTQAWGELLAAGQSMLSAFAALNAAHKRGAP